MTEADLKAILVKKIRLDLPNLITIRHEDHYTGGVPDISLTGNQRTLWIEVKFANPKFSSKGIQDLTMLRLEKQGFAFYVVYFNTKEKDRFTYIVKPSDVGNPMSSWDVVSAGFDHEFVIQAIKKVLYDDNYDRS